VDRVDRVERDVFEERCEVASPLELDNAAEEDFFICLMFNGVRAISMGFVFHNVDVESSTISDNTCCNRIPFVGLDNCGSGDFKKVANVLEDEEGEEGDTGVASSSSFLCGS
jgi:hypothetical protein